MLGLCWHRTNFTGVDMPLYKVQLKDRECILEGICLSDHRLIDGAQKLRSLASGGFVCRGYHGPETPYSRLGEPAVLSEALDKQVLTHLVAGNRFFALSAFHQLTPVLNELVGLEFVFSPFPEFIVLRELKGRRDIE